MPWILDGNNLAHGGDRERIRRAALAVARSERVRLLLFFDGAPPPGSPATEHLGSVDVRYVPDADRAILDALARQGRGWRVATDDRALAARAKAVGAEAVGAASFLDRAARIMASQGEGEPERGAAALLSFEGVVRLSDLPRRVPRRRKKA